MEGDRMSNFQLGPKGTELIQSFEGLSLKPYYCPAGILTVGYGHTGSDIQKGKVYTQADVNAFFKKDIQKFVDCVNNAVKVQINQHQFDAMVSLAYNIGPGAFKNSTLLRVLNEEKYELAAGQFAVWKKGGGKVLPGLVRRRAAEEKLFRLPVEEGTVAQPKTPTEAPKEIVDTNLEAPVVFFRNINGDELVVRFRGKEYIIAVEA